MCGTSVRGDRKYQQDAYYYRYLHDGICAAVCDGMGGIAGGERASEAAVTVFRDSVRQMSEADIPEADIAETGIPEAYKAVAVQMDEAVCALKDENGAPLGGGSTVAAVHITGNKLFWMSVGDSRIYLIRDREIISLARPHIYGRVLDEALQKGEIDEVEYEKKSKKREALTSYLGMGGVRIFEYNKAPFMLCKGDVVLVCSDGLYKALSDRQIEETVERWKGDFLELSDALTEEAEGYGRRPLDNCTVIAIKYIKDGGIEDGIEEM